MRRALAENSSMRKLVVNNFLVTAIGDQYSGWGVASKSEAQSQEARTLVFDFEIEGSGGGFILAYHSKSNELYGDTWHKSEEEAIKAATEEFGIPIGAWEERLS